LGVRLVLAEVELGLGSLLAFRLFPSQVYPDYAVLVGLEALFRMTRLFQNGVKSSFLIESFWRVVRKREGHYQKKNSLIIRKYDVLAYGRLGPFSLSV